MTGRPDGRTARDLRPTRFVLDYIPHAEGSVLIEAGTTRVVCTVSVEEKVPFFLRGAGQGWVTAEYAMLPRATQKRTPREVTRGRPAGRTQEIQRLIGRALRSVVDMSQLGERTFWIDCDVIQADGGTRTASITGAYVALASALARVQPAAGWERLPLDDLLAAVSVGIVNGEPRLDLVYEEDSTAQVDLNVVMTAGGRFVEIQGTAESAPFSQQELDALLDLARNGIERLCAAQRAVLPEAVLASLGKPRKPRATAPARVEE